MRDFAFLFLVSTFLFLGCSKHPKMESLASDRFGPVKIFFPEQRSSPEQFVIYFPKSGSSTGIPNLVSTLTEAGAVVALMDTDTFEQTLRAVQGSCLPLWEFARFTQVMEGRAKMGSFVDPIVLGDEEGGALVYAMLATLSDTFRAGVSFNFCNKIKIGSPLCQEGEPTLSNRASGAYAQLIPGLDLNAPWTVSVKESGVGCNAEEARKFVAATKGATLTKTRDGANAKSLEGDLFFLKDILRLPPLTAQSNIENQETADLPLVLLKPEQLTRPYLILLLSGDGGWASIDKELGEQFRDLGVPVVGLDSLSYFWHTKSPEQITKDISRIMNAYLTDWSCSNVILVGYSLGADVLPFVVNRLDRDLKAKISATVLLNPSQRTSFEVHMTDWLNISELERGEEIAPEVKKLSSNPLLCVYGEEEEDSPCKELTDPMVVLSLPGGHHFDGDYHELGNRIMQFIDSRNKAK